MSSFRVVRTEAPIPVPTRPRAPQLEASTIFIMSLFRQHVECLYISGQSVRPFYPSPMTRTAMRKLGTTIEALVFATLPVKATAAQYRITAKYKITAQYGIAVPGGTSDRCRS